MRFTTGCPVCGMDDGCRHRAVLTFASLVNACAIAGITLLVGLAALAIALANA